MAETRTRARIRHWLAALLYIAPALMLIVGISYFAAGYNVWLSTLTWDGISTATPVGLANYGSLLADPVFWGALANVAIFGVLTVTIQLGLGLLLALVLSGSMWGRTIYKALIFIPVVLAPAAVATAFRQFLRPDGQVNQLLEGIGFTWLQPSWLADPQVALYALVGVNIFQWTGFSFLLYQSALSQVDLHSLEAAQLDSATTAATVWYVVIPQLRGTHLTLILAGVIGSLKTFDLVFLLTGGGPGRSTEFLTTYIHKQGIVQFHVGYGATLSVVLLFLALLLTWLQTKLFRIGKDA